MMISITFAEKNHSSRRPLRKQEIPSRNERPKLNNFSNSYKQLKTIMLN